MSNNEMMLFQQLQNQLKTYNDNKNTIIEEKIANLYAAGLDAAFIGGGWGEHNKQIVNTYGKINRYGTRFCMDNYVKTGYTFITRPELNLGPINLRTDRIMNLLSTPNPMDLNFAIRAWLDTRFARTMDPESVELCPFIDPRCPFMTILTNNLVEMSGGPSYQLEVFTDEPGFHGESQSMVIGSDSYRKPFDLQLTFVDPIGGPIEAIMRFWMRYMELVAKGVVIMYPDQEAARILNYTVSIYRFLMDPSFRYIRKWFKYTGCFPINRQGAAVADFNSKDLFVEGLRKFSVGFRCASGVVDEDDPIVIKEFNDLVARYFPDIRILRPGSYTSSNSNSMSNLSNSITDNLMPDGYRANMSFVDRLTGKLSDITSTVLDKINPSIDDLTTLTSEATDAFNSATGLTTQNTGVVNNMLISYDTIDSVLRDAGLIRNPLLPEFNYSGVPYILDTPDGLRMEMISKNVLHYSSIGAPNMNDVNITQSFASAMDTSNEYETDILKQMFIGWDEYGTPINVWPAMSSYATDVADEIMSNAEAASQTIQNFIRQSTGRDPEGTTSATTSSETKDTVTFNPDPTSSISYIA